MQKILLVSQVAALARKLERKFEFYGENLAHSPLADAPVGGFVKDNFARVLASADYDDGSDSAPSPSRHQAVPQSIGGTNFVIDPDEKDRITGTISQLQKMKIIELLGDWEEPERTSKTTQIRIGSELSYLTCSNIVFVGLFQEKRSAQMYVQSGSDRMPTSEETGRRVTRN
jgi:hypothetical protein